MSDTTIPEEEGQEEQEELDYQDEDMEYVPKHGHGHDEAPSNVPVLGVPSDAPALGVPTQKRYVADDDSSGDSSSGSGSDSDSSSSDSSSGGESDSSGGSRKGRGRLAGDTSFVRSPAPSRSCSPVIQGQVPKRRYRSRSRSRSPRHVAYTPVIEGLQSMVRAHEQAIKNAEVWYRQNAYRIDRMECAVKGAAVAQFQSRLITNEMSRQIMWHNMRAATPHQAPLPVYDNLHGPPSRVPAQALAPVYNNLPGPPSRLAPHLVTMNQGMATGVAMPTPPPSLPHYHGRGRAPQYPHNGGNRRPSENNRMRL